MFNNRAVDFRKMPVELFLIAPLLALSNSVITAFSTGLIFWVLLVLIAVSVSAMRNFTVRQVRVPMLMLITATWISLFDIVLTAWFYDLRQAVGIYLPLLAINSLVFAASEEYYLRLPLRESMLHALRTGAIVLMLFLAAALVREILAFGSLFRHATIVFNEPGIQELAHPDNASGLLLAGKAPGAFICLGLVFALWNYCSNARRATTFMNKQGHTAGIE